MSQRSQLSLTIGILFAVLAVLAANDVLIIKLFERRLYENPEILAGALEHQASKRRLATREMISSRLTESWNIVRGTQVFAVMFDGSNFRSRLARLEDVGARDKLNLVVTDYRCGFCKADLRTIEKMMRNNVGKEFAFVEAAVLGDQSVALARAVLERSLRSGDYYRNHTQAFLSEEILSDASALTTTNALSADRMLQSHRDFASTVGIRSTPTYVLGGQIHVGALQTAK